MEGSNGPKHDLEVLERASARYPVAHKQPLDPRTRPSVGATSTLILILAYSWRVGVLLDLSRGPGSRAARVREASCGLQEADWHGDLASSRYIHPTCEITRNKPRSSGVRRVLTNPPLPLVDRPHIEVVSGAV